MRRDVASVWPVVMKIPTLFPEIVASAIFVEFQDVHANIGDVWVDLVSTRNVQRAVYVARNDAVKINSTMNTFPSSITSDATASMTVEATS